MQTTTHTAPTTTREQREMADTAFAAQRAAWNDRTGQPTTMAQNDRQVARLRSRSQRGR